MGQVATEQQAVPGAAPVTPPGGRAERRRRGSHRWPWGTALALGVLAALFALPLRGLLLGQGPPMEEGFMLVFPEQVLRGELPNRDFLHLYGPGSLWVLAAVYEVFGTSLTAERLVALLQHVGLVLGVFALARPWGRPLATLAAGVTLVVIVPPTALVALAWEGALALGVWAVWAALRSRHSQPPAAGRWAVLAGVLAGLALLYRPDLVLATGAGTVAALWGVVAARRNRFLVGLVAGLAPYLVHLATAGVGVVIQGMVLDPVVYLRGGRRLPIPPPSNYLAGFLERVGEFDLPTWPLPALRTPLQLRIWFFLVLGGAALLLAVAVLQVRGDRRSTRARVLLAVACFCVGLLPQGIQRTDATHFAWASAVTLGFVPIALLEVQRRWAARVVPALQPVLAGAVVVAVLVAIIPNYTVRRYTDYVGQTFGYHRVSFPVTYEGRTFYYGRRDVSEAMDEMLPVVDRVSEAGDRLFVGPHDLRYTPYSDAFLYFLFPELDPATYYIEMDPMVANREGSGLDDDLASSDVVILSRVWYNWEEPNASLEVGSEDPVRVLEDQFCLVGNYGQRRVRAASRRGDELTPEAQAGDPLYELYVKNADPACPTS